MLLPSPKTAFLAISGEFLKIWTEAKRELFFAVGLVKIGHFYNFGPFLKKTK